MTLTIPLLSELGLQPWKLNAACRDQDGALWYPERGCTALKARQVCAQCPVLPRCLEFALSRREYEGVWGGAAWRRRRRLHAAWMGRLHDYSPDCDNPKCRWCRTVDLHRAECGGGAGPMQLNGPAARCGFKSTYARGCRCGVCSLAISPAGAKLRAAGYDIADWWTRWFGDNTEKRLLWRAKRLVEFDTLDVAA